jgi:hypothetical protein
MDALIEGGNVNDFTEDDARALYTRIDDPTARAVLDFLVDHPGERFNAAAIQQQLGLPEHRDVALAMYYLGNRFSEVGKARPWNEAQVGYLLSPEQADVFRNARNSQREEPPRGGS